MRTDQFHHITIQQLEALVHLVEERTFARAATHMRLSQPPISKHIKNLENFINASILERSSPGITLTPQGRILFTYAKRILKLRDEARVKIIHAGDTKVEHIFVGAGTISATYILPKLLSEFTKQFLDLVIHMNSGDSADVLNMLINDQVQIAFIGKTIQDKGLVCTPLWQDRLELVAHKDHPLAKLTLADPEAAVDLQDFWDLKVRPPLGEGPLRNYFHR
jgi:DNA-binding transcriptional LysR family regulator